MRGQPVAELPQPRRDLASLYECTPIGAFGHRLPTAKSLLVTQTQHFLRSGTEGFPVLAKIMHTTAMNQDVSQTPRMRPLLCPPKPLLHHV